MAHADMEERDLVFDDLLRFRGKGLIGPVRFGPAAFAIRDHEHWGHITRTALLWLAAGHLIAGAAYLFAFQWEFLSDWQVFAILQCSIVALAAPALAIGLASPAGQTALIGATLMTGLLVYTIEQLYPTSAGQTEALLAWTLIVLPWVIASRSSAHWILWTAIALFALHAAIGSYLEPSGFLPAPYSPYVLAAVPALMLLAGEQMRLRGAIWLRPTWPRHVLMVPVFWFLSVALIEHLFPDLPLFDGAAAGTESIVIFICTALVTVWLYRIRVPDYGAFATAIAFSALAVSAVGARIIDNRYGLDPLEPSGLLGWMLVFAWASACAGGMAVLLRQQGRYFDTAGHHAG